MSETVAVLGAGNMGTALAQVIAGNGHAVRLWSIEHDVLEEIKDHSLNTKYLEDVSLHDGITAVWDLAEAVDGARLIVISVPSQIVPSLARDLAPSVTPGQLVLNVAKGLEAGTHRRMSEAVAAELARPCTPFIGSMGGPAIAIDMARGLPLAIIIAIADPQGCADAQSILQNRNLKVEATRDVTGLELCATLKNVYAIALGICDGIGHGTNYKAFLSSVALAEMKAINVTLGGQPETVYGLAGVGDLLTTGFSEHSRNRTMGQKLGEDSDWKHFLETNTVEGVVACKAISELVSNRGLAVPLLDTVYDILFDPQPAPAALYRFFQDFSYN